MKRILLLTENILVDESFQKKLQILNLEVFTSATFIKEIEDDRVPAYMLNYFQIAILSETIAEAKADRIAAILKKANIDVVRKFDQFPCEELELKYINKWQQNWLNNGATIEDIRERISSSPLEHSSTDVLRIKEKAQQQNIHLTKRERKLLERLSLAEGQTVSREDLCHYIWEDKQVTQSRLSALSAIVQGISKKNQQLGIQRSIHTFWGRGYSYDKEFIKLLKKGDYLF